MSWYIFYICCVLISLHAFYLLVFKTYETNLGEKTDKRILLPNIIYLLIFVLVFVPFLNLTFVFVFYLTTLIDNKDEFMVDSWLFKKLGQKSE